jgi:hypothetical protein
VDEGVTRIREGKCTIVVDEGHWPVVFSTWIGEPNDLVVKRYFEKHRTLLARAREAKSGFVIVNDTKHTGRPSGKVRRLIADETNGLPADATALTLGTVIVVESAIIRAIVTALTWILPSMKDSVVAGDLGAGIQRALLMLDERRIARPPDLSPTKYRRPTA